MYKGIQINNACNKKYDYDEEKFLNICKIGGIGFRNVVKIINRECLLTCWQNIDEMLANDAKYLFLNCFL